MEWMSVLIVAFLLIAAGLWILYLIIRAGVRDGMLLYRAQIKDAQKAQEQAKEQHQALCGSCGQLYSEELPAVLTARRRMIWKHKPFGKTIGYDLGGNHHEKT